MPLFPVLEIEALVQAQDKTRLDGSKSYAGGVNAITQTEIQPGEGGAFVDVTGDDFLDWQFDADTFDVSAGVNDKVDFSVGGTLYAATLTPGEYTLAELADEIALQMGSESGGSFTGSVSGGKFTLSSAAAFALLGASGTSVGNVLAAVGFDEDADARTEQIGDEVEELPRTILLRITNDDSPTPSTVTIKRQISTISEANDRLFSTDDLLRKKETDVLKFVPAGRATWKDIHRAAQSQMLAWLDTNGYIDDFGVKLTKNRIKDISEVREWATMTALRLIFDSISNTNDDVFFKKARQYEKAESFFRNRAVLRIDLNEDGEVNLGESLAVQDCVVVRR